MNKTFKFSEIKDFSTSNDTVVVLIQKNKHTGSRSFELVPVDLIRINRDELVETSNGGLHCSWTDYHLTPSCTTRLHDLGMDGWEPWSSNMYYVRKVDGSEIIPEM